MPRFLVVSWSSGQVHRICAADVYSALRSYALDVLHLPEFNQGELGEVEVFLADPKGFAPNSLNMKPMVLEKLWSIAEDGFIDPLSPDGAS